MTTLTILSHSDTALNGSGTFRNKQGMNATLKKLAMPCVQLASELTVMPGT